MQHTYARNFGTMAQQLDDRQQASVFLTYYLSDMQWICGGYFKEQVVGS